MHCNLFVLRIPDSSLTSVSQRRKISCGHFLCLVVTSELDYGDRGGADVSGMKS